MALFQPPPMTRYDVHFTLVGFPVRIHPLFWVMVILFGLGTHDLVHLLIWVVVVTISILVHELGYAFAMRRPAFWRTSSIASEPNAPGMIQESGFYIDPSALEGMTGSPVVGVKNDRVKLLGVYSDTSTAAFGANAGFVWDATLIQELLDLSERQ